MATRVYLLRHGKTVGSDTLRYKGQTDVPLSDEGIAQAEKAAQFISSHVSCNSAQPAIDALYSSDLSRCVKTAEIVGASFNLTPITIPEFRERHFGQWEGMSFDEINEKYPEDFTNWAKNPLKFSPIGGESTEDVSKRTMPTLKKLIKRHLDKTIAIVAHGGTNRVILCNLLKIPLRHIFRLEQDFACINIIDIHENYPVVLLLNHTQR
ncbi:alpha-ribazole phosphatase [Candidatus Magnetomonas plexicatena]|uniref:alpha-ribazole phosphatase n=1 Tax=Candidatus Magnetomonas plexicatena TaxID=2552947 RepID=UPI001C7419D8|nr:alpha-ribazole phosphatase [Nitrospirales bacterium LBB_01]